MFLLDAHPQSQLPTDELLDICGQVLHIQPALWASARGIPHLHDLGRADSVVDWSVRVDTKIYVQPMRCVDVQASL